MVQIHQFYIFALPFKLYWCVMILRIHWNRPWWQLAEVHCATNMHIEDSMCYDVSMLFIYFPESWSIGKNFQCRYGCTKCLISLDPVPCAEYFEVQSSNRLHRIAAWVLAAKLLSDECHRTPYVNQCESDYILTAAIDQLLVKNTVVECMFSVLTYLFIF